MSIFSLFFAKYKISIAMAAAVVLLSVGIYGGYKLANYACKAEKLASIHRMEKELAKKQDHLTELEVKLVEATRNTRIVYRDKVIEVVKHVNNDSCTIEPAGVQLIKCAVTATCE